MNEHDQSDPKPVPEPFAEEPLTPNVEPEQQPAPPSTPFSPVIKPQATVQPRATYNYQHASQGGAPVEGASQYSASGGPAASSQPKIRGAFIALIIGVALFAGLMGAVIGGSVVSGISSELRTIIPELNIDSTTYDNLAQDTNTDLSVQVAKKVLPTVVSIQVTGATAVNPFTGQESSAASSGSGVIIRSDGYILTNNHVIEAGQSVQVTAGTETYDAKVVGSDPSTDLAVLKIEATSLPAIKIGSSSNLEVGSYVMAVGSPFGLEKSVSTGIISGLGRSNLLEGASSITAYINLIQTDAAINPGNSGGALVDAAGQLIGINTLISSTSGSSAGVGFAIPVDSAMDIANQLIDSGKASHPFLGVSTQSVNEASAKQYGLPVNAGAYVVYTSPDSPAEKAGLTRGDIIVKIGNQDIDTTEDVFTAVRSGKAGEKVTIEYYRSNEKKSVEVTLGSDANQQNSQGQDIAPPVEPSAPNTTNPHGDMSIDELLEMLKQYGLGQ